MITDPPRLNLYSELSWNETYRFLQFLTHNIDQVRISPRQNCSKAPVAFKIYCSNETAMQIIKVAKQHNFVGDQSDQDDQLTFNKMILTSQYLY